MQDYIHLTLDFLWELFENMLLMSLYFDFDIWYSNKHLTTSPCIPRDEKCEGIKNGPLNFYQIRALAALMIWKYFLHNEKANYCSPCLLSASIYSSPNRELKNKNTNLLLPLM